MDPLREFGKTLIFLGLIVAGLGVVLFLGGRLPLRLGRLPGDIAVEGRRGSFYFPIVTCLLLSVVFTLAMWLVGWLRK
jgi:ABC-type tungstate transport system substrate-binding protein